MLPQPLTTYQFRISIPECGISSELIESADLPVDPWGESAVSFRGMKVSYPTVIENGGDWECTIPESIFLIAWTELASKYYRQFYNKVSEEYTKFDRSKQSYKKAITRLKSNMAVTGLQKIWPKTKVAWIESDIGINDRSLASALLSGYKGLGVIGKDINSWMFRGGRFRQIGKDINMQFGGLAKQLVNGEAIMGLQALLRLGGFCKLRICLEGLYLKKISPSSFSSAGATENVKMKATFHYNRAYPMIIYDEHAGVNRGIDAILENAGNSAIGSAISVLKKKK